MKVAGLLKAGGPWSVDGKCWKEDGSMGRGCAAERGGEPRASSVTTPCHSVTKGSAEPAGRRLPIWAT